MRSFLDDLDIICWGLLLAAALLLCWGVLAQAQAPRTPPQCTHYAASNGSGSACSAASPCQIASWWPLAGPGKTLCLKDGTYQGDTAMLRAPSSAAGTAAQPMTIRAERDGAVTLDGQGRRPLDLQGAYGVVEGINVRNGDNNNIAFRGHHWRVSRVTSRDVSASNTDHSVSMGGNNNLFEDSFVWGRAEKGVAIGNASQILAHNIVRRVVVLWQDQGTSPSPTDSFDIGYGQAGAIVENVIGLRARTSMTAGQPIGMVDMFRCDACKLFGSLFLVRASDVFDPSTIVLVHTDGGSSQSSGNYNPSDNNVVEHNVAVIDPAHPQFSSKRAWSFAHTNPGPAGMNNHARRNVGVSGQSLLCQSPDWTCTEHQHGSSLAQAIGTGRSVWTESVAAPGICRRYEGGTLTQTPLWPWPMQSRILQATDQALDIQAVVESLLGPIPPACQGDTPPSGDTTPPAVAITAPSPGALISGASVAVTAEASDNVGVAGVQWFVNGEPRESETSYPWGRQIDTTTLANGNYTLTVQARDGAGNTTMSAEVAVTVFNGPTTPMPPAGHPALACTGSVAAVPGTVQLRCEPAP